MTSPPLLRPSRTRSSKMHKETVPTLSLFRRGASFVFSGCSRFLSVLGPERKTSCLELLIEGHNKIRKLTCLESLLLLRFGFDIEKAVYVAHFTQKATEKRIGKK